MQTLQLSTHFAIHAADVPRSALLELDSLPTNAPTDDVAICRLDSAVHDFSSTLKLLLPRCSFITCANNSFLLINGLDSVVFFKIKLCGSSTLFILDSALKY